MHLDILALILGYFIHAADDDVPATSPHLRDHQGWYRDVLWDWLAARRSW